MTEPGTLPQMVGHANRSVEPFGSFMKREYPRAVRLGLWLTGDFGAAEDLAQEAFAAAHEKWDTVGAYDSPFAWVSVVVSNRAVSRRRRRASETVALARAASTVRVQEADRDDPDFELWNAVRALPRRQKQAIALVYGADLSLAATAETMGVSEETLRTHLKRARRALADQLQRDEA